MRLSYTWFGSLANPNAIFIYYFLKLKYVLKFGLKLWYSMFWVLIIGVKSYVLLYSIWIFFKFSMNIPYFYLKLLTSFNHFIRNRVWYDFKLILCAFSYLFFKISYLQNCQSILHNILVAVNYVIFFTIRRKIVVNGSIIQVFLNACLHHISMIYWHQYFIVFLY